MNITNLGSFTDDRGTLLWASQKLLSFDFKYITIGTMKPGTKRGGHYHKEIVEKLMCITGKLGVIIGEEKGVLRPGDIVDIPHNKIHYVINNEEELGVFVEFKDKEFSVEDTYTE